VTSKHVPCTIDKPGAFASRNQQEIALAQLLQIHENPHRYIKIGFTK